MDWGPRKTELDRLHRAARVRRVRSLVGRWMLDAMRAPRVAAPAPMPAVEPGQLAIVFGGHASVLLRTGGLTIAFDPMLGRWAGGAHRAVASAFTAAHLAAVGLVLVSHAHRDHLHLPTLEAVPRSATVVVPSGAAAMVSPLGFARVVELRPGAELVIGGVKVTATALEHGRDPLARTIGYVVDGDGPRVFLCGDAGYGPQFAQVGARFAPDVAVLPIGGFLPWAFRARHLSPLDALYAFEDLGARMLIPIHHGAFALSYERLDEPERWLRELVAERGLAAHVRILPVGGAEVFTVPVPLAEAAPSASSSASAPAPVPAPTSTTAFAPEAASPPRVRPGTAPAVPPAPFAPAPSSAAISVPVLEPAVLATGQPAPTPPAAVARTATPRAEPFDDETVVEPAPGSKLGGTGWPRLPR